MNVRYWVELSEAERVELQGLLSGKRQPVRRVKRAQILLASDLGQSEEAIARAVGVGISTVYRTRRRCTWRGWKMCWTGMRKHPIGATRW